MMPLPPPEPIEIAVRAYAPAPPPKPGERRPKRSVKGPGGLPPSDWTLTWDTEFTIDAAQQLTVGAYQVRDAGSLVEAGLIYDPGSLTDTDRATVYRYALDHGLNVRDVGDFVDEVFYRVVYDWRGVCVGMNLPVDLARLAIRHRASPSPDMRGGFTLTLTENRKRPTVQIRHLNSAEALIRFTFPARQSAARGMRKRGYSVPKSRGWFVDVHTAAASLLEHRGDLRSMASLLGTRRRKGEADFTAVAITPDFLDYAVADVQVTWECYEQLLGRFEGLGLGSLPLARIFSAASLGKAHLDAMGVQPWRSCQPDFDPVLIGHILSAYFGGRSEVHLRRVVTRVLYADFLSMYPTVCALMSLWRFVVARGVITYDATEEVHAFLASITPEQLQDPAIWRRLAVLVEIEPACDLLPVRGRYAGEGYTIGLNYLSTEDVPVWYTFADAVADVINGGHVPMVRRALGFRPGPLQSGLRPVDLMGNPAYRVDPTTDDVFRRFIELRTELKARRNEAKQAGDTVLAEQYDAAQLALKILANATSYGIFIELNVTDWDDPTELTCYGRADEPFARRSHQVETPGRFFHPLLGALVTGGARLMLSLAERQLRDAGLDWVFCDTDSMAIAQPVGMPDDRFLARAQGVLYWFEPLKPYSVADPLFKLEDANFALGYDGKVTGELAPLYCFAVSDKRYALFNIDGNGRPVLRKASAHGLGHLRPPYEEGEAPASIPAPAVPLKDIGVARWQYDLWYRIVLAALEGHPAQVDLADFPGLDAPAVSRYAATTPELLQWFDRYNFGKPYREQVRPFGFLLAFQAKAVDGGSLEPIDDASVDEDGELRVPAVVAPYSKDPASSAQRAFDRQTGEPVAPDRLRTYREVLAQYHLHPEAKFRGGDYLDTGPTSRRHVQPLGPITQIGKEANRWEEQFYLGANPETQIDYGVSRAEVDAYRERVRALMQPFGVRALSRASGVSIGTVSAVKRGLGQPSLAVLRRIDRGLSSPYLGVNRKGDE